MAWEKINGDNDAGKQERSEPWFQEGKAKAAADADAAADASTAEQYTSNSLVSPLPAVVASQIEFIKHTLRAHNAHVRSSNANLYFYVCAFNSTFVIGALAAE